MQCPNCDATLPSDAHFCIECGTPIPQAATGQTQRIERATGPHCPSCHTANPAEAIFCVKCGRALNQESSQPASAPFGSFDTAQPPATTNAPSAPVPSPASTLGGGWSLFGGNMDSIAGGVFLIGLAVLFLTRFWWPGIMIVIGLSGAISSLGRNRTNDAMQTLFWTIGIAIIAINNWWWPGMLILFGISAIMGGKSWRKC